MFELPKLDFLPNPPNKGLPTPKGWGQTWDYVDKMSAEKVMAFSGSTAAGGVLGAALGALILGAPFAAGFGLCVAGATLGAATGGTIIKLVEKKGD